MTQTHEAVLNAILSRTCQSPTEDEAVAQFRLGLHCSMAVVRARMLGISDDGEGTFEIVDVRFVDGPDEVGY